MRLSRVALALVMLAAGIAGALFFRARPIRQDAAPQPGPPSPATPATPSGPKAPSSLPEKRPDDAVFDYSWTGGGTGDRAELVVSASGGTYEMDQAYGGVPAETIHFQANPNELDHLYQAMRERRLDDMPRHDGPRATDYGHRTIALRWDGGKRTVTVTDDSSLVREALDRFNAIQWHLERLEGRALETSAIDVVFTADEPLANVPGEVVFAKGESFMASIVEAPQDRGPARVPGSRRVVAIIPGKYKISARVNGRGWNSIDIDLAAPRAIRVSAKDEALALEDVDPGNELLRVDAATAAAHGLPPASIFADLAGSGLVTQELGKTGIICSSAPDGPLGLSFEPYSGVVDFKADAVEKFVAERFAGRGYVAGSSKWMQFGRAVLPFHMFKPGPPYRMVVTCLAGQEAARAWHFLAFFPRDLEAKDGILLDLSVGTTAAAPPKVEEALATERVRSLLASLRIHFE
jgi:hypothetical protein